MKAGLRAKEMASLTWAMVTEATGQVGETIQLENRASKGKTGGRTIPLHPDLQDALTALQTARRGRTASGAGGALLGARRRVVARHGALVVPSALYLPEDGRLLVALGTPDLHYARRAQSLSGRGEPPGRAGTRGPYQPGHDATLY
jgi:hypothetical protein